MTRGCLQLWLVSFSSCFARWSDVLKDTERKFPGIVHTFGQWKSDFFFFYQWFICVYFWQTWSRLTEQFFEQHDIFFNDEVKTVYHHRFLTRTFYLRRPVFTCPLFETDLSFSLLQQNKPQTIDALRILDRYLHHAWWVSKRFAGSWLVRT